VFICFSIILKSIITVCFLPYYYFLLGSMMLFLDREFGYTNEKF
jgi:hypothetical protein